MYRLLPLALLFLVTACQTEPEDDAVEADPSVDRTEAPVPLTGAALIAPTAGNTAQGQVTFVHVGTSEETRGSVRVRANISGLAPNTTHGFHIHEFGSCGEDGQAAGGHFNPGGSPHGAPDDLGPERHAGDMGNIESDDEGRALYDAVIPEISFEGATSVVGRAIIVHEGADDLTSQPTGDAGGRIGCGVIELAADGV